MDKHNNNSGGFLFGLIAGVIITLLFTTKKGRKILKVLTDEGMDRFGKWQGIVKDVTDVIDRSEEDTEDDYVGVEERPVAATDEEPKVRSKAKRFFKGAKRKNKESTN